MTLRRMSSSDAAGVHPVSRRTLVISGTRPECIKLAPLVSALAASSSLEPYVVNSGQHAATVRGRLPHASRTGAALHFTFVIRAGGDVAN